MIFAEITTVNVLTIVSLVFGIAALLGGSVAIFRLNLQKATQATLEADNNALRGRVDTLEGERDVLTGQVATLSGRVGVLSDMVTGATAIDALRQVVEREVIGRLKSVQAHLAEGAP